MNKRLVFFPQVDKDVDEASLFIAQDDLARAYRFLDATSDTYRSIAEAPGLGSFYSFQHPDLQGIRRRFVKEFPNYLIFYRETYDTVEILRVLHGSRDLSKLFGDV